MRRSADHGEWHDDVGLHRGGHRLTGRALVQGVLDAPELHLRSAVARSAGGRDLDFPL
jgi:hypothetical protein